MRECSKVSRSVVAVQPAQYFICSQDQNEVRQAALRDNSHHVLQLFLESAGLLGIGSKHCARLVAVRHQGREVHACPCPDAAHFHR